MPDAYGNEEGRFIQVKYATSAVDALLVPIGPVPAGKIWTVLEAFLSNSCAAGGENQYVWFAVSPDGVLYYPVTTPEQHVVDASNGQYLPMLREGMELRLWPGEYLAARRGDHTAGSTIIIYARIIESDMPLYTYDDPQTVLRQRKAISSVRTRLGGGVGGARIVPPTLTGGDRGGRGGPLEK